MIQIIVTIFFIIRFVLKMNEYKETSISRIISKIKNTNLNKFKEYEDNMKMLKIL